MRGCVGRGSYIDCGKSAVHNLPYHRHGTRINLNNSTPPSRLSDRASRSHWAFPHKVRGLCRSSVQERHSLPTSVRNDMMFRWILSIDRANDVHRQLHFPIAVRRSCQPTLCLFRNSSKQTMTLSTDAGDAAVGCDPNPADVFELILKSD